MKKKPTKVETASTSKRSNKKVEKSQAKPTRVVEAKATEPPPAPAKDKRIRGSFSMPGRDYALIAELKARSKQSGRTVKKNELLRAGLHALSAMKDDDLQSAMAALKPSDAKPRKKAK